MIHSVIQNGQLLNFEVFGSRERYRRRFVISKITTDSMRKVY